MNSGTQTELINLWAMQEMAKGDATATLFSFFSESLAFGTEQEELVKLSYDSSSETSISDEEGDGIHPPNLDDKSWIGYFQRKLDSMRNIPDDWNGFGSASPNVIAIRNSQDVLDILHVMQLIPKDINPSADDGIGITFSKNDRYAIIECYNDGDIVSVIYKGDGEPTAWNVGNSLTEIRGTIETISDFIYGSLNS
jgi:hypothetical protein